MLALYSLTRYPACFEFFNWLVIAKAEGASKIVFDISDPKTKKFSRDNVMQRFHTIIQPGPAMAGLNARLGTAPSAMKNLPIQLLPWFRVRKAFDRLQSVRPAVRCDYTVTIRNNHDGAKGRDSNQDAWREFAKKINAVVIEDYFDKPIHLHERFALYAGAKMNFGVCNGPIYTLSLTPYPVVQVANTEAARNSLTRWGFAANQDFPWALGNQHIAWDDDTLPNLLNIYDRVT